MLYITLFFEFFKTGLFAVGGGLATLPFLYAMADKYPWFTREMLANMIAIGESTPGPIGVNIATYTGYTTGGIFGSVCSTVGLVLPSFLIIVIIYRFLSRFGDNFYVQSAFYGIRPATSALIVVAAWGMIKSAVVSTGEFDIFAGVLLVLLILADVLLKKKKIHPLVFIVAGALIGILKGMFI